MLTFHSGTRDSWKSKDREKQAGRGGRSGVGGRGGWWSGWAVRVGSQGWAVRGGQSGWAAIRDGWSGWVVGRVGGQGDHLLQVKSRVCSSSTASCKPTMLFLLYSIMQRKTGLAVMRAALQTEKEFTSQDQFRVLHRTLEASNLAKSFKIRNKRKTGCGLRL